MHTTCSTHVRPLRFHHQRENSRFGAIPFLRRFSQTASGFHFLGFRNINFLRILYVAVNIIFPRLQSLFSKMLTLCFSAFFKPSSGVIYYVRVYTNSSLMCQFFNRASWSALRLTPKLKDQASVLTSPQWQCGCYTSRLKVPFRRPLRSAGPNISWK
jgi:hypothetical protein